MARHVHLDAPAEYGSVLELAQDLRQGFGLSGQHARPGAVGRGHAELALSTSDRCSCLLEGQLDQSHLASPTDSSKEPAPAAGHGRAVLERQSPRNDRCRYLAHAVSNQRIRLDSPRPPQGRQSHLHGEQHGLDHVDAALARYIGGVELRHDRPPRLSSYRSIAGLHRREKFGLFGEQLPAHAEPLRTLP
jgi:hypothetical protein